MPIQFPPRPWVDGQKYVFNGTSYVYEASTNSWRFSSLTYRRLYPSMQFEVPSERSSFFLAMSRSPLFETVARAYDSGIAADRSRMMLFSTVLGQFVPMSSSEVSSTEYSRLVLVPEADLSTRYYCRFRWTSGGRHGQWASIVVPAGYTEGSPAGSGQEVRSVAWGNIVGAMSNQSDLKRALDGKINTSEFDEASSWRIIG